MEKMTKQLDDFDMGCIFHDTPDGNGGSKTHPAPIAGKMAQYGKIMEQAITFAENPNGPIWKNYVD